MRKTGTKEKIGETKMTIKIDETRISKHDLPKREEYMTLVDSQATDISQGSKDLLKKLFDEQQYETYNMSGLWDCPLTAEEKGHFTDLIKKDYVHVKIEEADRHNNFEITTWFTILLNGKAMEI